MEPDTLLRMIRDLSKNETFTTWRDEVIEPTIKQLEAELSSEKADELPEVILRAKLKHLSSLKYLFKDIFQIARENLKNNK